MPRAVGTLGKHGSGGLSFPTNHSSFHRILGIDDLAAFQNISSISSIIQRDVLTPKSYRGGQGEPFYRNPEGFEKGIWMWMDFGRDVFTEKWGRGPCDLREAGLVEEDAWRVVKDWENPDVQKQFRLDREEEAKEQLIKEKATEKEIAKEMRGKEKPSA